MIPNHLGVMLNPFASRFAAGQQDKPRPGPGAIRRLPLRRQRLLLQAAQPGTHVLLMFVVKMGKKRGGAHGLTFQPGKAPHIG